MKNPYEVHGLLARSQQHSSTVQAGRRDIQADAEKLIVDDVALKLGLRKEHSLLDIGCGPGALLCPLSSHVTHITGIDHPDVLALTRENCKGENITLIPGQFPEVSLAGTFDRILAYSVLHYMPDFSAVERFIDAAIGYLKPNGRILLGDLPNADARVRFKTSETGKKFEREWQERMKVELGHDDPHEVFEGSLMTGFTDERILHLLSRYRKAGYNTYLMSQPHELPFGRTREDMLIKLP